MTYKAEFADGSEVSHCAIGAMRTVANQTENKAGFKFWMAQALKKYLGVGNIPNWNDAKGRTIDEVREAFLMTAKDLRNKE